MTELDKGRAGDGAEPRPGAGSPFFPGAPGLPGPVPPQGAPLPAPPAAAPSAASPSAAAPHDIASHGTASPGAAPAPPAGAAPHVEGRITVGDEVAEKVAALAALEVGGVAALGSGVRVRSAGDAVTVDVGIAVEYGHAIMDVAAAVQAGVARMSGLMLGARVAAVNVAVEDVRPQAGRA
ncbi:Asp23/Gls24 family envelope stress response protein [Actinomadura violacea]|uniref:Asp23/Gls24 family envelope stress response protein n=1 Tax=Actinomadura violacea TaxID=2819934 RepID=A0ABS3S3Y8_9ACTN|nr:Asp23/Gls24 family envelope stress response protein [Actinomadura violacea]MBO2463711.1 Asp23/Gls24 family envelope stress response protein [Actinomadura violacea]